MLLPNIRKWDIFIENSFWKIIHFLDNINIETNRNRNSKQKYIINIVNVYSNYDKWYQHIMNLVNDVTRAQRTLMNTIGLTIVSMVNLLIFFNMLNPSLNIFKTSFLISRIG